jgi:exonuclease VII small subunit
MSIKIEGLTFDEAIDKLEKILENLGDSEKNGFSMSNEEIEAQLEEAERLKNHCKKLLEKEREDIIRTAKENNIPLEEIGLDDDSMNLDFDDELKEEEE